MQLVFDLPLPGTSPRRVWKEHTLTGDTASLLSTTTTYSSLVSSSCCSPSSCTCCVSAASIGVPCSVTARPLFHGWSRASAHQHSPSTCKLDNLSLQSQTSLLSETVFMLCVFKSYRVLTFGWIMKLFQYLSYFVNLSLFLYHICAYRSTASMCLFLITKTLVCFIQIIHTQIICGLHFRVYHSVPASNEVHMCGYLPFVSF